jgi:uncharacterized protein YndB with AHSA1/START domain
MTDRIVKSVVVQAPPHVVWPALTDARAFGTTIDRIDPMRLLSFRWHPFAIDRLVDYSNEPSTLVEFALEQSGEGTRLTVTESGFDKLPAARRAKAFEANAGGWEKQMDLVRNFVEKH